MFYKTVAAFNHAIKLFIFSFKMPVAYRLRCKGSAAGFSNDGCQLFFDRIHVFRST